jgi:hypothetical protein
MSVESATEYVRVMVQRESRGPGDLDNAMHRIEARYGLPFWSLWHLRKGKAKSCEVSLYQRIRGAYFDMCQRQADNLLHEIELEAAAGDDTNQDLANRLRAMAAEIETRRQMR